MKVQKQGCLLKVMAKKELAIKTYDSENGKIFVLEQNIKGYDAYQQAKAIESFINRETKVLEMAIETYLRQVFRNNGITIQDGSHSSLERAFIELENKGKQIVLNDRYYNIGDERIVGESTNDMTVILEDEILSCAMEVSIL